MLHDPEEYPEPEHFKPERFIGENGQINPEVLDPRIVAFGFGRRYVLVKRVPVLSIQYVAAYVQEDILP